MRINEMTESQIQVELEAFEIMNEIVRSLSLTRIKAAFEWLKENADPAKKSTETIKRILNIAIMAKSDYKILLHYYKTYLKLKPLDKRE